MRSESHDDSDEDEVPEPLSARSHIMSYVVLHAHKLALTL